MNALLLVTCEERSGINEEDLCAPVTKEKVSLAVSQLNDRAPGVNYISAEFLKPGGEATVQWLTFLFFSI